MIFYTGESCERIHSGRGGKLADGIYGTNPKSTSAFAVRQNCTAMQLRCVLTIIVFFAKFSLKLIRQVEEKKNYVNNTSTVTKCHCNPFNIIL